MAARATQPDRYGFLFPGRDSGLFGTFYEMLVSAGGELFDERLRPAFDSDAGLSAATVITELHHVRRVTPRALPAWHYDEISASFRAGHAAMVCDWPGSYHLYRNPATCDGLGSHRPGAAAVRLVGRASCLRRLSLVRDCRDRTERRWGFGLAPVPDVVRRAGGRSASGRDPVPRQRARADPRRVVSGSRRDGALGSIGCSRTGDDRTATVRSVSALRGCDLAVRSAGHGGRLHAARGDRQRRIGRSGDRRSAAAPGGCIVTDSRPRVQAEPR